MEPTGCPGRQGGRWIGGVFWTLVGIIAKGKMFCELRHWSLVVECQVYVFARREEVEDALRIMENGVAQ